MTWRLNNDYEFKNLEYATKMTTLSPDFHTIWNYKWEIMDDIISKQDGDTNYKMLCGELLVLIKQMKENPKSYTVWFHRQWTILKGLDIEKYMSDEQLMAANGGILLNELNLCDKML